MYTYISSRSGRFLYKKRHEKNMTPIPVGLAMMGASMAGNAVGTGAGLAIDKLKQKWQIKQAKKLQDMQIQGSKEIAEYNQGLALKMWEDTNAPAQRKQLEKAGLNVGLMYGGGSGGSGATTVPGGSVSGQGTYVGEQAGMGMQLGQQMALQAAQIKLINAQAEKTEIEAQKTAGVDTENVKLQNEFKKIENEIKGITKYDEVIKIMNEAEIAAQEAYRKPLENAILSETQNDQIQIIKREAVLKAVEIKQREAGINLTEAQTQEVAAKIERIAAEISRMDIQNRQEWEKIMLDRMQKEFNTSTPAQIKQWTDIGVDMINATKLGKPKPGGTNTVKH